MATEYHWPDTRERAIKAFNGDTPGESIEAAILTHFREHPGRVHNLIDAIGRRVTQGQVRSGWAILKHELDHAPSDIVATDNHERALHLRLAELWINNAGGYIDRKAELEDALFGDLGPLHDWPELKPQIIGLWERQRPRFQRAEAETETRAARFTTLRQRIRTNTTHAAGEQAADEHAERIATAIEHTTTATATDDDIDFA